MKKPNHVLCTSGCKAISYSFTCMGLPLLVAAGGLVASAESIEDYPPYEIESDAVIESEIFAPRLTFTNPSGGEVVFYGQLNPVYQIFDDGEETTDGLVDNGNWNTRLGLRSTQPLNNSTLRFRLESGLGLRSSAAVSQEFQPDRMDWQRTALRWFETALDTSYGTLSLGQGSTASDGVAGLDESFTFVAGAVDSTDGFSAFRFRDGNGELTDVTVGAVNNNLAGARRFRARYDTPRYGGVMLSSSYGRNILVSGDNRNFYDVALRSANDVGDFSVQSAIGYGWDDDPDGENQERVAGSMTVVHNPSGLNLLFAAGSQISGPDYYYTRGGWRTDLFACGTTSLSVDYYHGRDFISDGARTENYGAYAVQSFDALSVDAYAGWRRFTYSDQLGGSYQDADGILAGTRWFF